MAKKTATPNVFKFVLIAGPSGSSYAVRLAGANLDYIQTPPDHKLQGESPHPGAQYGSGSGDSRKIQVSEASWSEFRECLERLEIWDWKPHYDDSTVMEGTQWILELTWGEKSLCSGGSNAYPVLDSEPESSHGGYTQAFSEFLLGLRQLLGGVDFGES